MESPTYTVLSNGTHTDSTTGVRYKVKAGEIITMQRAVNLGLPGAVMPTIYGYPAISSLSDVTLTNPHEGDMLVYHGSGWVNQPPSWNFGLENNDLIRWGKDNSSDWTTFERYAGNVVRSGAFCLHLVQSADRRTMSAIDAQAGGSVEGQAVVFGTSAAMSYTGIIVPEGDGITVGVWIRAANGGSAGNRVWLMSFQDSGELSVTPLVLTTSYQHIALSFTATNVEADVGAGAAVYIFIEGDEGDAYYIDDASFVVTPA